MARVSGDQSVSERGDCPVAQVTTKRKAEGKRALQTRVSDLERRVAELEREAQLRDYYRRLRGEIEEELRATEGNRPRTLEEAVAGLGRTVSFTPDSLHAALEEDDD